MNTDVEVDEKVDEDGDVQKHAATKSFAYLHCLGKKTLFSSLFFAAHCFFLFKGEEKEKVLRGGGEGNEEEGESEEGLGKIPKKDHSTPSDDEEDGNGMVVATQGSAKLSVPTFRFSGSQVASGKGTARYVK